MNTPSKFIKPASEAEDRLSNLPESILCYILSFLPTKDAAKTSILSKTWRYLFLSVPKINLTDTSASGLNALVRFINRRLMSCTKTSITSFRLICRQLPEASLVHQWFAALALRNVEVLDIQVCSQIPKYQFGEHILWQSLMVLKLDGSQIDFKLPESAFFPNLKVLKLIFMKLQSNSETYKFSDEAFPRLEDLRLQHVIYDNADGPLLYISSSTLKILAITDVDERKSSLLDIHIVRNFNI